MADQAREGADLSAAPDTGQTTRKPARSAGLDTRRSTSASAIASASTEPKVQQPKPQALPSRAGPSSILVSPRQKGNPILNNVRSMPWEYSDIPADYVLGHTTCALFLSLKYHRLHPEYIYSRIRALQGKYNLRILLTMVDIENHEESLKELSKTSIINNVTIMLCWSAQEAGRYLELFKTYEHAAPTSIRAHQSTSYKDKLEEFITVPRGINKTDAMGLISSFGSLRTAVNARPEEVALIAGWGEKKVQRWCSTVREPFRIKRTAKRGVDREDSRATLSREASRADGEEDLRVAARLGIGQGLPISTVPNEEIAAEPIPDADRRPPKRAAEVLQTWEPGEDEEEAMREAVVGQIAGQFDSVNGSDKSKRSRQSTVDQEPSEGILQLLRSSGKRVEQRTARTPGQ